MLTGAIVTWSLVCFFFGNVRADNSCSAGWFGNYCQYKCHCNNSTCDTNGDCVGTTPCERGWFGYKCQYQDLSSLADTSQQRLIDGDDSTCNEDLNVTSVSFTLKTPFLFSWMRLVFHLQETLKKLTIEFKTMNDTIKCQDPRILQGSDTTFDIYCTISVKIQVINITGDSTKYLCSVYLSGGRNVAIRQPTQQSSNFKEINGVPTGSENAVDGNADRNYEKGSCTHTDAGDLDQTWSVKFNTSFVVNKFVLYNRDFPSTSNVPRRLQHFILLALNEIKHLEMQYQDQEAQVLQVYTVNEYITNPISQVNISTGNKTDNYLTLCEVEIYGDCPEGRHNLDCNQNCDTKCGHHCNTYDGSCNYICLGFSNPPECNKTCDRGKWGMNCNMNCSQNCFNSNCDRETGICVTGCRGFSDPPSCTKNCPSAVWGVNCLWCNEECPESQWGDDCSNNCSSNCWGEVCNKLSGLCESGCHGFSNPPDCTQSCPDGSWGLNCHSKCSTQCINQICHSVTGHCMFNCTEGCNYLTCTEVKETGKNEMTFGAGMGIGFVLGIVVIAVLEVIMLII
ncbi:platelet endothelial aggregation receptor 1-like isoform X2 [Biomphalaria pfeifferi]|uniref:Platelet endothelial aggregation receptor 1-like isoform X2 n=1 Tax=Biomphalaria pfeifferi TaxID=112525 RepID=A0AAD8C3Y3_BIOPF|nr:platelet endothelial aggregation receptor 1-like isoform X2 [Biomphalaria pfeifferi]